MKHAIDVSDVADEAMRKAIIAPLIQYNDSKAGPSNSRPLVVALRDSSAMVAGGLWGHTSYGWLFVQFLAVPESLRGHGWGTRLMSAAEDEARARGCKGSWLDTFEFQAKGFYEKLGYVAFGELTDYPPGQSRFFFKKTLG